MAFVTRLEDAGLEAPSVSAKHADVAAFCAATLRRLDRARDPDDPGWDLLAGSDLLALAVLGAGADQGEVPPVELAASVPDLVGAVFRGERGRVDAAFNRLLRCFGFVFPSPALLDVEARARLLARTCSRFSSTQDVVRNVLKVLTSKSVNVTEELCILPERERLAVFVALLKASSTAEELDTLFGQELAKRENSRVFEEALFSSPCRIHGYAGRLCSYLGLNLAQEKLFHLLRRALELWADPVIARAYVAQEVIHISKVVLLVFIHMDNSYLRQKESSIIEALVRGLPNHFSSSDGRTVELAKYLSEIITESLKFLQDPYHKPTTELAKPQMMLCSDLLNSIQECRESKNFWLKPTNILNTTIKTIKKDTANLQGKSDHIHSSREAIDSDDDDDSSDLEPIESVDAPSECKIKYLRHFFELMPELKNRDELAHAFKELPNIVKHQLIHEHEAVGKELLDLVFFWENDFDDASLDHFRRSALESVIETCPLNYLRPFCLLFHREHVQPYRKNIILEVLSSVSKKLSLPHLQVLADTVFSSLVLHDGILAEQDVVVKIPLILFLGQTVQMLPPEMVREDMVLTLMASIQNMKDVDVATEQTICYTLGRVMASLGTTKLSPKVREGISEARNWILAIQMQR